MNEREHLLTTQTMAQYTNNSAIGKILQISKQKTKYFRKHFGTKRKTKYFRKNFHTIWGIFFTFNVDDNTKQFQPAENGCCYEGIKQVHSPMDYGCVWCFHRGIKQAEILNHFYSLRQIMTVLKFHHKWSATRKSVNIIGHVSWHKKNKRFYYMYMYAYVYVYVYENKIIHPFFKSFLNFEIKKVSP